MSQKLLILDDEFYGRSKKDAEHFKSLVSRSKFTIRRPYGRIAEDIPRLAVLCGTSNKRGIVNDSTGNRRIIPVEITGRNFELSDSIDRDRLFSELISYYDQLGELSYKLEKEEMKYLNIFSEDYQLVNAEKELIQSYVSPVPVSEFNQMTESERERQGVRFCPASVVAGYIERESGVRIDAKKIGQEMSLLGFEQIRRRTSAGSNPIRGYCVRFQAPKYETEPDDF